MTFFDFQSIEKIRQGYFSAVYFNRTKEILLAEKNFKSVTMQIFQKNEGSMLCGVEEVRELLQLGCGYWNDGSWVDKSKEITFESLKDGDTVELWETVMHITGPYAYFAHLESIYLGILARRTLVTTNIHKAVHAARGKQVIFFADRFDDFHNQRGDGYAAKIGGAQEVCTEAMSEGFGRQPVGTIPHALIAMYGGNTVQASKAFIKQFPTVPLFVLVDFDNNVVQTSLEVARELKDKLWGVRIDTAENMIDESFNTGPATRVSQNSVQHVHSVHAASREPRVGNPSLVSPVSKKNKYGVSPTLIRNVRTALDREGFPGVKIVVSGGFDEKKIKLFEAEKAPVDVYGVGSALLKGNNDFTADIVKVGDTLVSKEGRHFKANKRIKRLL